MSEKENENIQKEGIHKAFKNKGYKATSQRLAIIDLLRKHKEKHLSAEEIYSIVKQNYPNMGIATVYRTLSLLEEMNIIKKIHLHDDYMRYELIEPEEEEHEHHHLICDTCGKITDIHEDLLDKLEKQVEKELGFRVKNHRVFLYGTCKDCFY